MNRAREPRPSPFFPTGLLLVLAVLSTGVLSSCGQRRTAGLPAGAAEIPDQEVRDFALTETDEGKVEWKLYAQYAAMYDVRNTITARGVRVDFYDDVGRQSSRLTAREGEINQATRDMTARGNVVLQNSDGTRMSTQSLRFLNRDQKIQSDVLVRVEKQGNVLSGVGFESDPELKQWTFKSKIEATVRSRSEELLGPRKEEK